MVPVENVTDEIDSYPGTPLSLREGRVHHLHGPGGSGKTTACLNWAARVTAAGKVAYWIDTTNGFSAAKFTSFLGAPALLHYMRAKMPKAGISWHLLVSERHPWWTPKARALTRARATRQLVDNALSGYYRHHGFAPAGAEDIALLGGLP